MFPTVFELLTDEADPVQIHTHGELFVLCLRLGRACAFLRQRLMIQSESENYVRPNLACVKLRIKAPKLDCAVTGEEAVQVQEVMIS